MSSIISSEHGFDDIEAEANKILKQALDEKWVATTYHESRSNRYSYGFTSEYLWESANLEQFSSSEKMSTLLKLAKLDLEKGTTIGELVFSCCAWFPKKEAIESLIDLGKKNESEEKVIRSLFEFHDHEGFNCFTVIFNMTNAYHNRNYEHASGHMLVEIEESCQFLIKLVKSAKLDSEYILNYTTDSGVNLFSSASRYSKTIMKQLLKETNEHGNKVVRVNSINHLFQTPSFRVRLKTDF